MVSKKISVGSGGQPKSNKLNDPRTLFVKFDPPSAFITRQHLADHFSNYGPVNRCSVIRSTKSKRRPREDEASANDGGDGHGERSEPESFDRGSKGYGFVRFVNEDDAKSAADAVRKKSKGGGRGGGEIMVVDGVRYRIIAERASEAASAQRGKGPGDGARRADGAGATRDNTDLRAEARRKRTSRVIVRNLSFYANDRHVKSAMESNFGPVAAVDLPSVPDLPGEEGGRGKRGVPRHRGFAFVTFTNANAARMAVERGGEIKIKKRAVAIDFSVSKVEHVKLMKEEKDKEDDEGAESSSESGGSESGRDDGEEKNASEGSSSDSGGSASDSSDGEDDSESKSGEEGNEKAEEDTADETKGRKGASDQKKAPEFDEMEARRTLFLRNVPFDATRRDVFDLFRGFGRVEAAYLVKDRGTGVFKGTAFVRFAEESGCVAAMEASSGGGGEVAQFVSGKNMAMGLGGGGDGGVGGLTLRGRRVLVDLAVDRKTASSLAVRRDAEGRPIKRAVGKDRRNLYLKNEGRVSSSADSGDARAAGAMHGGVWEDLPPGDRARRERAFADRSAKLRSPLFFINPTRISVRNLAKHVDEAGLKRLVFGALRKGLEQKLVTPRDAVSHWSAGGELAHGEVMRRATDPDLVTPPLDEKNMKGSVPSVFIDRDVSGGLKSLEAPSRGFGFVEFTHHSHALAVLRQLNNNPMYSAEYAAGGKHAAELAKRRRKGGKKAKVADPETGAEFLSEDGKVCVPRLIVEFTVENKVKARQQAEKIAQKKANKIKQRMEKKEKQQPLTDKRKKAKTKGRGALQREKKRARKDAAGDEGKNTHIDEEREGEKKKKPKLDDKDSSTEKASEKTLKTVKPKIKRTKDADDDALEEMIRTYKSTFSKGGAAEAMLDGDNMSKPRKKSREKAMKKRWFE